MQGSGMGLRPWSRSPREFLGTSPLTSLFLRAVCIVGPNGVREEHPAAAADRASGGESRSRRAVTGGGGMSTAVLEAPGEPSLLWRVKYRTCHEWFFSLRGAVEDSLDQSDLETDLEKWAQMQACLRHPACVFWLCKKYMPIRIVRNYVNQGIPGSPVVGAGAFTSMSPG